MNNAITLLTRAAETLGTDVVTEALNLSVKEIYAKMGKAYQSFNDPEYKAWSDILLYKQSTFTI